MSWSQVIGSGLAVFSDPGSATTDVTCPIAGTYVFRLTADDGAVRTCDEVQVIVSSTYVLTVLNDGQCTADPAGATVQTTGSPVAISATPASGRHFAAWVVVSGPGLLADWQAASTTITATADTVIRATCALNTYTLSYNAGAGGSVSGQALQTVAHSAFGISVTAVPAAGRHFVAWSDGLASATRIDGPVTADLALTATFAPNAVAINCAAASLVVPEGGSSTLGIWTCAQPAAAVTVQAAHAGGDADIAIAGGGTLTFTTANWNVPQAVTLAASDDADLVGSSAQISLSAAGLDTVLVSATERDDDAQQSIVVGSSGSGSGSGGCGAGLGMLLLILASLSLRQRERRRC